MVKYYALFFSLFVLLLLGRVDAIHAQQSIGELKGLTLAPEVDGIPARAQPVIRKPVPERHFADKPERLTATSKRGDALGQFAVNPSDSVAFSYSKGRGGDDVKGANAYDTMKILFWNSAKQAYSPAYVVVQGFDGRNLRKSSTTQYFGTGSGENLSKDEWSQNRKGGDSFLVNYLWDTSSASWLRKSGQRITYNALDLPDTVLNLVFDPKTNTALQSDRTSYEYNKSGTITSRTNEWFDSSRGQWFPINRVEFFYTGSNLLQKYVTLQNAGAAGLKVITVCTYYYNQNDQLTGIANKQVGTSFSVTDSVAFSGINEFGLPRETISYWDGGSGPNRQYFQTDSYSTAGLLVSSLLRESSGPWVDKERAFYFYNEFDQLIRKYSESFYHQNWQTGSYDYDYRYFYGSANASEMESVPVLKLSPVPANDVLGIVVNAPESSDLAFSIINVQGQVLRQWNRMQTSTAIEYVDVSSLPQGQYIMHVNAAGKASSQAFQVFH